MPDPADPQAEIFRFLADPRTHGLNEPVKRVDTAGAVVFLAGTEVYKVKRAVAFPFMDLSTLDRRRRACEAEIAVNRDSAPGVYIEAVPIVRAGAELAIGGAGEPVEWAVHMRRFDETATLDRDSRPRGDSRRRHRQAGARDPAVARAGAVPRRRPRRPCHRDLYRAERRRLRRTAGPLPSGESAPPHPGFAPRLRRRAAGAACPRGGGIRAPLPWRSAFAQHRPRRGRADPVRRGRILRRGRERRRALRSRLPADGSGGAGPSRRSQPAVQPLSRARAAGSPDGSRGAAAVPEPARGDPGEGRGGRRRRDSRGQGATKRLRWRAAISTARPGSWLTSPRASSQSADCLAWARARWRRRLRRASAARPER